MRVAGSGVLVSASDLPLPDGLLRVASPRVAGRRLPPGALPRTHQHYARLRRPTDRLQIRQVRHGVAERHLRSGL